MDGMKQQQQHVGTSKNMKEQLQQRHILQGFEFPAAVQVFRGPLLIAMVLLPLLTSYIFTLSFQTIVSVGLVLLGLGLTCHDVLLLGHNQLRTSLSKTICGIVLDDVLRAIFDPNVGLIACVVSTVVGNASMYTLGMTKSQRVRLLQSCLWISEEETEEILLAPGGVRQLLPQSIQQWLKPTNLPPELLKKQKATHRTLRLKDDDDEEEITSDGTQCETDSDAETTPKARSIPTAPIPEPDPLIVMGSILKELGTDSMKRVLKSIPSTWISDTCTTGGMLLLTLYAFRRRRPRWSMAALTAIASSVYWASKRGDTKLLLQTVLGRGKQIMPHLTARQLQASIAFLVLYYFGKRRTPSSSPSS